MTTEVRVELEDLGGRTRRVMTHSGIRGDSAGAAGWATASTSSPLGSTHIALDSEGLAGGENALG
jgi:hypothetical protein